MRLAYADPPYLGTANKHYGKHHPEASMWDDVASHIDLMKRLSEYDGWAYSLTSTSLVTLLPYAPPCRIAAWVKPFAAFKPNVRMAYTWEPVLFVPARDTSKGGAPLGRDHLAESITLRRGLTGVKPDRFNDWILCLLGFNEGDTVDDLFPGSGGMGRAVDRATPDPGGRKRQ